MAKENRERDEGAARMIDSDEGSIGDDDADVPALHGWRRELFGDKALALKRGRLSLAIDQGRVVALERGRSAP